MHRLNYSKILLALTVAGASLLASAQDLRIGAINVDKVMRVSAAAKAGQAKLEQEFSKKERALEAMAQEFKASLERFEKESPTLAESQRISRQKQLTEQDRELQRRRREFQEDLGVRRSEETQIVIERLNRALKQFAESEKYDVIFQEAAYINPRLDVTDKVISVLNAMK
jgi:outer membrane protein